MSTIEIDQCIKCSHAKRPNELCHVHWCKESFYFRCPECDGYKKKGERVCGKCLAMNQNKREKCSICGDMVSPKRAAKYHEQPYKHCSSLCSRILAHHSYFEHGELKIYPYAKKLLKDI